MCLASRSAKSTVGFLGKYSDKVKVALPDEVVCLFSTYRLRPDMKETCSLTSLLRLQKACGFRGEGMQGRFWH